ncbi:MAG: PadR family transcriptional regulator [Gemmatimonadota bacterium]
MSVTGRMKPHWFHILLAVADQALHGTAIMEEVLDRTEGELRLWPGMLYGSLKEMDDAGWIEEVPPPDDAPTEGGKRRFYRITAAGRGALADEVDRLAGFVRDARAKRIGPQAGRA